MKKIFTLQKMKRTMVLCLSSLAFMSINAQIILEAESATLFGDLKVKTNADAAVSCSGGSYIGDFSSSSSLRFSDVQITESGWYDVTVFYICMGNRSVSIKANNKIKLNLTIETQTNGWNGEGTIPVLPMTGQIYLKQGSNTIVISAYNGDGPNLDKIELVKSSIQLPEPADEKFSSTFDYTDGSLITALHENATLKNLTDNDESTIYSVPSSGGVTEIVSKCESPILLTGFLLASGTGNTAELNNWVLESSKNGEDWTLVTGTATLKADGIISYSIGRDRADHATAEAAAAQYYKLTVPGENISIGEWQLYGFPYLSNTDGKNFPEDLLADGIPTVQPGKEGASGEGWSEGFTNLFNRDMSMKYYTGNDAIPLWFAYELPDGKSSSIASYSLTSADDFSDRAPKDWVLSGYDGNDWIPLSSIQGAIFPCNMSTLKYNVISDKKFLAFQLDITKNNGSGEFQLLKFQLFGNLNTELKNLNSNNIIINSVEGGVILNQESGSSINYKIYDVSGKIISQGISNSISKRINLLSGLYIVKGLTSNNWFTAKVVIK